MDGSITGTMDGDNNVFTLTTPNLVTDLLLWWNGGFLSVGQDFQLDVPAKQQRGPVDHDHHYLRGRQSAAGRHTDRASVYHVREDAMKKIFLFLFSATLYAQVTPVFPGGIVGYEQLKLEVNGVQTSLTATLTTGAAVAAVNSCAYITANMLVTINQEIIASAGCTGSSLTIDTASPGCTSGRACDGTVLAQHSSGAPVNLWLDAWHDNSRAAEIIAIETALGANLSNVPGIGGIVSPAIGGTGVNNGTKTLTLGGNTVFSGAYNPTIIVPQTGFVDAADGWDTGRIGGHRDRHEHHARRKHRGRKDHWNGRDAGGHGDGDEYHAGGVDYEHKTLDAHDSPVVRDDEHLQRDGHLSEDRGRHTAALNAASPAIATVTAISPAFSGTNDYVCTLSAQGTGAPTHVFVVNNVSASSFTVTGPNGASDAVDYICVGF